MTRTEKLTRLLQPANPSKRWISERIARLLGEEAAIPSFSAAALKLANLTRNPAVSLDEIEAVIKLDPGLTTRCLGVASSARYGSPVLGTIHDAILRIGMAEVRRIAFSVGVMDSFSRLRVKINWNRFWLHSILVARLTDNIAGAFRESSGAEYLTGLLHDAGKIIIEHYFPEEFEKVLHRAWAEKSGHAHLEVEFLGITHAQVGAVICECLSLHNHIESAVLHHHDDFSVAAAHRNYGDKGFLAACVAVADSLAHRTKTCFGGEIDENIPFDQTPAWQFLAEFGRIRTIDVDLMQELSEAEADLQMFTA